MNKDKYELGWILREAIKITTESSLLNLRRGLIFEKLSLGITKEKHINLKPKKWIQNAINAVAEISWGVSRTS